MKQLRDCKSSYETDLLQAIIKLYDLNLVEVIFRNGETFFRASDDIVSGSVPHVDV